MRGDLTLNQSETDKSKLTNLKSTSIFFMPVLFEIINMAYFTHPFHCGRMLLTFYYPATLVQGNRKKDEVRGFCRLMLSNKGFMHN